MNADRPDDDRYDAHLLTLLSVSAAMVGVCLTAIGLVGILQTLGKYENWVDELLAVGALVFMGVTMMSFLGLRTGLRRRWRGFSSTLDVLFCVGLVVLVVAALVLTYAVL
jgi:hypothetical protein